MLYGNILAQLYRHPSLTAARYNVKHYPDVHRVFHLHQHNPFFITIVLFSAFSCWGQNYAISTFAGQGLALGDGAVANNALFGTVSAVALANVGLKELLIISVRCNDKCSLSKADRRLLEVIQTY